MRTPKEIQALLDAGESVSAEFKRSFDQIAIAKAVTAFRNDLAEQGGGILLIGVDPKTHAAVGTGEEDLDDLQQRIANICREAIDPSVSPDISVIHLQNPVIAIDVVAGERPPYRLKQNCYVRVGTTTRRATFEDELGLYQRERHASAAGPIPGELPLPEEGALRFVGRTRELEQLWHWINDPLSKRHCLAGEGGVGKTAIAYELTTRIQQAALKPYEYIVWMSAKRMRFAGGEVIPRNADFWDLNSALDGLLRGVGFDSFDKDPAEKLADILSLFGDIPVFVVVDDVDSLEKGAQDAVDFLTFRLPSTAAKVLFTSRRELYGLPSTRVGGFDSAEGVEFIRTRLEASGKHPDMFSETQMLGILEAASGVPLYAEDLLRLAVNLGDVDEAVILWRDKGAGDDARSYALRREYEMLTGDAKQVLLAASVAREPLSGFELGKIAGISGKRSATALEELQGRFFVPSPEVIGGVPRFDLGSNTRTLVLTVNEHADALKKIRGAFGALYGDIYASGARKRGVGDVVKRAVALVRLDRFQEAERKILEGLQAYPEDPDLYGVAGWVYKSSTPRRAVDARERFRRAAELRCRNAEMYKHWVDLEIEDQNPDGELESTAAWAAALPDPRSLYALGQAQGKIGRRLIAEFQTAKGIAMLRDADRSLLSALTPVEDVRPGTYGFHGRIRRALLVSAATLCGQQRSKEFEALVNQRFREWLKEHPTDHAIGIERDRLRRELPEVSLEIADMAG